MRKKILFIISSLETGGVSKSMTSLMNVIDRNLYDVSLMIVSPQGELMKLLPSDLQLITNPVWTALTNRFQGIVQLLKMRKPLLAFGSAFRLIISKVDKGKAGRLLAKLMPGIDEEFDTIVEFNGQHQLYYMIDKLKAKKKITFFHSDYKKWPYYYKEDKKYFPKVHSIWSISDQCVQSLKEMFPEIKDKIYMMENISSLKLMNKLSEEIPSNFNKDFQNKILTIGHVCENKGSSLAIQSASTLKEHGIDFHWYFLGTNTQEHFYKGLVEQLGLQDNITFLGSTWNPYPYIKNADLIVHTSKFEGKSIALDEAKFFCKPIVVTNFSTVNDQFSNGVNASICEMNPIDVASKVEELISNKELVKKYKENLLLERKDNSFEINKLYKVFDE